VIVKIDYHPSAPQRRFHETESDEIGYGGEIGGGKTKALAMDALINALKYPGITMYCFRATYQQGEDTLIEEMENSYPPELARYNKEDTTWYYVGGSKLKMRQCRTLDDAMKNDGKEFNKLYIDEVQHLRFDVFDYLCTRPRANKKLGVSPQVKFTAMQGGKGHAWIKRTYIGLEPNTPTMTLVKDTKTGEEYEIYREFIPASLTDNKHVDDKYAGRLGMRSERLQKKVRTNDWNAVEGQAFPEWVDRPYLDSEQKKPNYKNTHVIPAFEIPAHWPIYRGYDYGRAKPYSVGWFTRGDEMYGNRLFMIHELYGGTDDEEGLNETVSQQADKIAAIEKPFAQKHGWIVGVADPSIFSKSPYEQEESIASVMEEHGVVFESPHHNPDVATNVINNRFQGKQLIHQSLLFDGEGYPGFQVFENCKKFRQHFPELVTDPKNPDDVDSDGTADHDYDMGRYVIVLTKPKIKAPVPITRRRRIDPLNFGERQYDGDDKGKVIQIPDIIIGGMK
jgi:hypothetical protein